MSRTRGSLWPGRARLGLLRSERDRCGAGRGCAGSATCLPGTRGNWVLKAARRCERSSQAGAERGEKRLTPSLQYEIDFQPSSAELGPRAGALAKSSRESGAESGRGCTPTQTQARRQRSHATATPAASGNRPEERWETWGAAALPPELQRREPANHSARMPTPKIKENRKCVCKGNRDWCQNSN